MTAFLVFWAGVFGWYFDLWSGLPELLETDYAILKTKIALAREYAGIAAIYAKKIAHILYGLAIKYTPVLIRFLLKVLFGALKDIYLTFRFWVRVFTRASKLTRSEWLELYSFIKRRLVIIWKRLVKLIKSLFE